MPPVKKGKLLLLTYIGFIIMGVPSGMLSVAWRFIQHDLNLTLSSLGTLLLVASIGSLATSFYSGSMIARIGMGNFLLCGIGIGILGYTGFVLASSWVLLMGAGVLLGCSSSAGINVFNTYVATNFRSRHMSWLHGSFGIGSTIGPLLVTFLVIDRGFSWQSPYIIIVVTYSVLAVLIFMTRQQWTTLNEKQDVSQLPTASASIPETLRQPVIWVAIAVFFFSTGTEIGTSQFANSLFVDGRGYDVKLVATWISTFWFTFTTMRLLTGVFIDRLDDQLFIRLCMLGSIAGGMLILLNIAPQLNLAGLLIMAIALAPIAPTLFANIPQQVGVRHTVNAMGFMNTGAGLGLALSPAIASQMSERVGLEFIPPFLIGLALITLLSYELFLRYISKTKRQVVSA